MPKAPIRSEAGDEAPGWVVAWLSTWDPVCVRAATFVIAVSAPATSAILARAHGDEGRGSRKPRSLPRESVPSRHDARCTPDCARPMFGTTLGLPRPRYPFATGPDLPGRSYPKRVVHMRWRGRLLLCRASLRSTS